ncbi:hypothetical protein NA57DRAFT_74435 [Rhizodiscina lignyota]|uniref:BTB domain-containing protein n=1 Tax=Rhizodiscina lignyota TaxID=1504668 RepID=A0A9P4IFJ7_9PEZI|nr:hypothetical protein NA57DRAFT_74435 [Rhizodiscina lignyota]
MATVIIETMTPESYEPPPMSAIDLATTQVMIGDNAKSYNVYKALLCASSKNFNAALNGQFRDGQLNELKLDDIQEEVFEDYVDWLFAGKICFTQRAAGMRLWDLYIFADRFHIPQLKRDAVNYVHNANRPPSLHFVKRAFNELPDKSPIRSILIDVYAKYWDPELEEDKTKTREEMQMLPAAFLGPVLIEVYKRLEHPYQNEDLDLCMYHEHPNDAQVQACRAKRAGAKNEIPRPVGQVDLGDPLNG